MRHEIYLLIRKKRPPTTVFWTVGARQDAWSHRTVSLTWNAGSGSGRAASAPLPIRFSTCPWC